MSETVQIALITFILGPIVLAIVNWLVNRPQRNAIRRIDNQVNNDHVNDPHKTSNLRDDIDEKHEIVMEEQRNTARNVGAIGNAVRSAARDIGGMRDDIRQLRRDLSHTDERVDDLERTRPPLRYLKDKPHE